GAAVTGVIDFGAMKPDHVAVDLARLLGDLVGDDEPRFEAGLESYRAAGGILATPHRFVRVLDRTGAVCGLVFWLLQLAAEPRPHTEPQAVAARLAALAERLEALAMI